jgi:hypothetical protein
MNKIMKKLGVLGLISIVLLVSGCILAATFIVDEIIFFTPKSTFYFEQVDLTDDETWEDHEDEIDFVDAVGVEFYITSTAPGSITFDAYIDDHSGLGSDPSVVPAGAIQIIDGFTIDPGIGGMSYIESLSEIMELDTLKHYGKLGMFDLYITTSGNVGTTFVIDSARVVITLSASS